MPPKTPKSTETYTQISELLEQIKEQGKFDTRLTVVETTYVQETDIHKMISAKIKEKAKSGIQWGSILERILIPVTVFLITYYLTTRGSS